MKTLFKKLLTVLLLTALNLSAAEVPAFDSWEQFLKSRDSNSYLSLKLELARCNTEQSCAAHVVPNSFQVQELIQLVETSENRAVEVAFLVVPFLEGGDLEDLERSLGTPIKKSPNQFLSGLEKSHLSQHQKTKIVVMLPLETVDDMAMRKAVVDSRIRVLLTIKKPSLIKVRNKAISDLRRLRAELAEQEAQNK